MGYIESIDESKIDSDVMLSKLTVRQMYDIKRSNPGCGGFVWITKRPVIDYGFTLYNPKICLLIYYN